MMESQTEESFEKKFGQFIKIMTPAKESDPVLMKEGLEEFMDLFVQ